MAPWMKKLEREIIVLKKIGKKNHPSKHTDVFASTSAGGVLLISRATTASLLAIT